MTLHEEENTFHEQQNSKLKTNGRKSGESSSTHPKVC